MITGRGFLGLVTLLGCLSLSLVGCPSTTENEPKSFRLLLDKDSLTIDQGNEQNVKVTVQAENGFDEDVVLSIEGVPDHVTAIFSAPTTKGSSLLTFQVKNRAEASSKTMTIKGTSGTLSQSANLNLTIKEDETPNPFTFFLDPSTLLVTNGKIGKTTISIDFDTESQPITLSVENVPAGVAASFSTQISSTTSELTLNVTDAAQIGTSVLTVKGTASTEVATKPLTLTVIDKPVPGKGNLTVEMIGLPGPWVKDGYVTVTGPNGYSETLFSKITLTGLEPGQYTVIPHPLEICYKSYSASSKELTITSSSETSITIAYTGTEISTQGFRGNVVGTHNAADSRGNIYFILDENNDQLHAYGCIESSSNPEDISDVKTFEGNVKNDFIGEGIFIAQFYDQEAICDWPQCTEYIYGAVQLTEEQVVKLNGAQFYLAMKGNNLTRRLLTQILPEGWTGPRTDQGGELEIIVNTDELPASLQNSKTFCMYGYFDLIERTGGEIGSCFNEKYKEYLDIYSGTYIFDKTTLTSTTDENTGLVYLPAVEGAPAEVRVGERKTVTITYKAAGKLSVAVKGLPTDVNREDAISITGPSHLFPHRINASTSNEFSDNVLPGDYTIEAEDVFSESGVYRASISQPTVTVMRGEEITVDITYTLSSF